MILRLDFERLRTLDEIRAFLDGNEPVVIRLVERGEAYELVRRVLVRFRYAGLDRAGKGLVKRFLGKATGFSRAQLTRLIGQHRATGRIEDRRRGPVRPFERRHTVADVRLLAEADGILGGLCGPATLVPPANLATPHACRRRPINPSSQHLWPTPPDPTRRTA